jgi:nitric oxide reductase large subunit
VVLVERLDQVIEAQTVVILFLVLLLLLVGAQVLLGGIVAPAL